MNEWEFIDWIKRSLSSTAGDPRVKVGVGDDMAVMALAGTTLLFGSDMVLEGVHFKLDQATPQQIGHKALAVCLSDAAAMGAEPLAALISFAKPEHVSSDVLQGIYAGLQDTAGWFDCTIVGGDSCAWGARLAIDVALLAVCETTPPVLRSGARPGDHLYVTGPLGGSGLGKHLVFTPRIAEARWLVGNLPPNAMIDISDGLSADLHHLCTASACGAELYEDWLQEAISDAARELSIQTGRRPLDHALNDGEDFELLVAIPTPPDQLPKLPETVRLLPVGRVITEAGAVYLTDAGGARSKLPEGGYRHF